MADSCRIEVTTHHLQGRKLIAEHIEYYNRERFQKKLGDHSPVEYREVIAA